MPLVNITLAAPLGLTILFAIVLIVAFIRSFLP